MSRHFLLLIGLAGALGASLAQAQSVEVNPYTGQPVTLESLSRELETAKAQTAVLEERVKQAQLGMTLNVVPLKQRAELQLLEKQAKEAAQVSNPTRAQPKTVEKPVPPPEPIVKLTSVIRAGDALSALLDVNGQTMAVKHGDQTPFGQVAILSDREVQLGARRLSVTDNTLSRFAVSDVSAGIGAPISQAPRAPQPVMLPPPLPAPPAQ